MWKEIFSFVGQAISALFMGTAESIAYQDLPTEEVWGQSVVDRVSQGLQNGQTLKQVCDTFASPAACMQTFTDGLSDQPYGWDPAKVTYMVIGGTVLLVGAGYLLYKSGQNSVTSQPTGQTYNQDEYSSLALYSRADNKEAGLSEFTQHFRDILKQYEGVEGALEDTDALEKAIAALFRYHFWQNRNTETDIKKDLYKELSKVFHTDRLGKNSKLNEEREQYLQYAEVQRYMELVGETKLGMAFQQMSAFYDHESKQPEKMQKFADTPSLENALRDNRDFARSISVSRERKTSTSGLDGFGS